MSSPVSPLRQRRILTRPDSQPARQNNSDSSDITDIYTTATPTAISRITQRGEAGRETTEDITLFAKERTGFFDTQIDSDETHHASPRRYSESGECRLEAAPPPKIPKLPEDPERHGLSVGSSHHINHHHTSTHPPSRPFSRDTGHGLIIAAVGHPPEPTARVPIHPLVLSSPLDLSLHHSRIRY